MVRHSTREKLVFFFRYILGKDFLILHEENVVKIALGMDVNGYRNKEISMKLWMNGKGIGATERMIKRGKWKKRCGANS